MCEPLNTTPKRLQRMLLALQNYDLKVHYQRGETIFLAHTLSRVYLSEVIACEVGQECESVDHRSSLPVSDERWLQLQFANDPVIQQLHNVIQQGWPGVRSEIPECERPYFDSRDQLIVQESLVFKRHMLVVPLSKRKELLGMAHSTHTGIEGCVRRMRDTLHWSRMATIVREYLSKCDICLAHRDSPGKEPIIQHEVIDRPWAKIGVDLCAEHGCILLIISDYSNYIEVAKLQLTTSRSVIREMKEVFARLRVPDIVCSDNGPQFASAGFAVFAKCRDSGVSEFKALLDWRNTPTGGVGTSPAQRLMGRRCNTLLPVTRPLPMPRYDIDRDALVCWE